MKKTGLELIAIERQEQLEKHKHTIESDKNFYNDGQLLEVAGALISTDMVGVPDNWNVKQFNYMMSKKHKEKLIIAGALICAEIDRLQAIEE
jgi:hypothetical protein